MHFRLTSFHFQLFTRATLSTALIDFTEPQRLEFATGLYIGSVLIRFQAIAWFGFAMSFQQSTRDYCRSVLSCCWFSHPLPSIPIQFH